MSAARSSALTGPPPTPPVAPPPPPTTGRKRTTRTTSSPAPPFRCGAGRRMAASVGTQVVGDQDAPPHRVRVPPVPGAVVARITTGRAPGLVGFVDQCAHFVPLHWV